MRDAAARSVDVPHSASVFIEVLAYRDCRVHSAEWIGVEGDGFSDPQEISVF